ncbi:MAG: hypothetical protein IT319_09690 [Anaerolineae bacterium]|nr:hypothetical protein [Anaerolineae bacterium]
MTPEALLVLLAVIGGGTVWGVRQMRLFREMNALMKHLRDDGALLVLSPFDASFRTSTIGGADSGWRGGIVSVTPEQITVYPRKSALDETVVFSFEGLRWFGRPVKYHSGRNEIWLHFEQAGRWHLIKLRMYRHRMAELVRTLKPLAAPALVTAYRRRRPYVHYGPAQVAPAEEDIHGAWTLDPALTLYLTPLHVVLLRDGQVGRVIALENVRKVTAMRRIDRPSADGLAVFEVDGEALAFAAKDYEALAGAIADAARRSLEEPLLQKQKSKKYVDDDDE